MPNTPLKSLLLDTLHRSGPITFEHFMALCLYHPEFGYYMQGQERTGVKGDYFTSPDLHPIFARLTARQAVEMWEALGRTSRFAWVEMGPGRGWFARDFLRWAESVQPDFFQAVDYVAIEPGPWQRALLRERLAEDKLETKVQILENLDELKPQTGCFFSNELVDAFPVSIVTRVGGRLKEVYVTAEGDKLREQTGALCSTEVAAYVAHYAREIEEGHRVEVSLRAAQWIRTVAEKLVRGFVVTTDYGDLAPNLYTPDRPQGTLMSYRGHVASEDTYSAPGDRDLTAHVNFSALIDAGKEAGLDFTGFTTQERFLLALGEGNQFNDLYDPGQSETGQLQARLKLKRLINPEGMGNIFKVLIQHRGVASPRLTGLRFPKP